MASKRATEVAKIRDRIAVLIAKIDASESMLLPKDAAINRASDLVDSLAEAGVVDGRSLADPGAYPLTFRTETEVLQLMCWLDPEAIKARLNGAIEDFFQSYEGSVDTPETHEQVRSDREALFDLEVQEERLVAASEEEGQPIQRRGDADPLAVLRA